MTDRRVKEYIIRKDAVAEFVKTVQEWKYQKDWEKKNCIFNPETGISVDGTMSDCLYRPWINQPKKEQKMTREDAYKIVLDDLLKIGLFRGEHDSRQGNINYLLGISTVMDYIAYQLGEEEYDKYLKIFYENLEKSEGIK